MTTTIAQLKKGQSARVIKMNGGDKLLKQRLLDMGITEGVVIKVTKIAPLGDPLCLSLRGYSLLVRKEDVKHVEIEVLK